MAYKMTLTTDNIAILAILTLDVRPSSVCISRVGNTHFEVQILRSETLFRPFDHYVQRFGGILTERFKNTALGNVQFDVKIVDALDYVFEEQRAWKLATSPVRVGE